MNIFEYTKNYILTLDNLQFLISENFKTLSIDDYTEILFNLAKNKTLKLEILVYYVNFLHEKIFFINYKLFTNFSIILLKNKNIDNNIISFLKNFSQKNKWNLKILI